MHIIIDGQKVIRSGFDAPSPEEVQRITDLLKERYSLGWSGIAALFGMQPTRGGTMNIKNMRSGREPMPMSHYLLALSLLGELNINVIRQSSQEPR